MKVQVLFFGPLAETAGVEKIEVSEITDTRGLRTYLQECYPFLAKSAWQIAVNKELSLQNRELHDGDEIALLSPFAGG